MSELYENQYDTRRESIQRDSLVDAWNEKYRDRLELTLAKITGFRRTYTWESKRGGLMLEAQHTGYQDDILNGLIISGLTSEEYESITGTEEGYEIHRFDRSEIKVYSGELPDFENNITLYTGKTSPKSNLKSERTVNETYNARIYLGFEFLREEVKDEVVDKFQQDFEENTYVRPFGASFYDSWNNEETITHYNTISQNKRALENLQNLL